MTARVVDVHVHLGASAVLGVTGSVDALLRRMDENGIDQAVLSPIPGQEDPDGVLSTRATNDAIAAAHRGHPDRFPRVLGAVEPRHGPAALSEVDRLLADLGFSGLSFHNDFQGFAVDHPAMFAIVERLQPYPGAVVQAHTAVHSWLEAPFQLDRLAEAFPSVVFLNAHPMMDNQATAYLLAASARLPNMHFDTCVTQKHSFPLERVVAQLGADRLLFGSDLPYFHARSLDLDLVRTADLDQAAKDAILGGNARTLFRLD